MSKIQLNIQKERINSLLNDHQYIQAHGGESFRNELNNSLITLGNKETFFNALNEERLDTKLFKLINSTRANCAASIIEEYGYDLDSDQYLLKYKNSVSNEGDLINPVGRGGGGGYQSVEDWINNIQSVSDWFCSNVHTYQGDPPNVNCGHHSKPYEWVDCPLVNEKIRDDCSGFVVVCLVKFGVLQTCKNGARSVNFWSKSGCGIENLPSCGFESLPFSTDTLQRGDIYACNGHVEICAGPGKQWGWGSVHPNMPCGWCAPSGKHNYQTIWRFKGRYIQGTGVDGGGLLGLGAGIGFGTISNEEKNKRYIALFGCPKSSVTKSLAESMMGNVSVACANGNKNLCIHRKLHADVQKMFEEIKATGYKVLSVGGFCWRQVNNGGKGGGQSIHSYGCAIDINACKAPDGTYANPFPGVLGSDSKPGVDNEYQIRTPNHPVCKIFVQHGWGWGGKYKDYMHFSLMGGG